MFSTSPSRGFIHDAACELAAVKGTTDGLELYRAARRISRAFQHQADMFAGAVADEWAELSLIEQLAVLADVLSGDATAKANYDSYAQSIGVGNLKTYAQCMVINLRRACEVSR